MAAQLGALTAGLGVYLLESGQAHAHLGWSANLRRRLTRLLGPSTGGSQGLLERVRNSIASVKCWPTASTLENALLLYELARLHHRTDYLKRLRLRLPWFVGLTGSDPFPRLRVMNRIPERGGPLFGPFPSRNAAQLYEQETLSFFQLRRCTERLSPHRDHPGCIYGEMNQCLRPCQSAVTGEEYASEAGRVLEFLSSNGNSTVAVLATARDRACEEMDFEGAGYIHKRIERIQAMAGLRDDVVRDAREFKGIALTADVDPECFRLWPMVQGLWHEPIVLNFDIANNGAKSLDECLRERLSIAINSIEIGRKRTEDLAIFARWYFSSSRDGQWFAFTNLAELNYRRLVREISKLAKARAET